MSDPDRATADGNSFPPFFPPGWHTVAPLLDAALDRPPLERRAFLDDACRGDPSLRAHLEVLVAQCESSDSLLDGRAVEQFSSLLDDLSARAAEQRPPELLAGRYRIERQIGAGGMAAVYLATDLKHERRVAVKIMRRELYDARRAHRFLREIAIAAALTHPHILPLHDSGEADGILYYVMPFIDGPSLRERLGDGPMPVSEAVRILRDVADALAAAHAQSVMHRDIKPENIMILGRSALVADFGIAKALSAATGASNLTSSSVALGTPAYMAPEQALGDPRIDHRADIYAFGLVAYETLAGRPPFLGDSVAATLAARISGEAQSVATLRPDVPPPLAAMVMRCLERNPSDRVQEAAELVAVLEGMMTPASVIVAPSRGAFPKLLARVVGSSRMARRGQWTGVAVGALLLAALLWSARKVRASSGVTAASLLRAENILLPADAPMDFLGGQLLPRTGVTLSPDGKVVVYVARKGEGTQLYMRHVDEADPRPLAATEGGFQPFFSPDGRWVAFFAGHELKKVSIPDGNVVTLATVAFATGGTWSADGRILIADDEGSRLSWVSADGGPLEPLKVQPPLYFALFPQLLPGDDWILYSSYDRGLYVTSLTTGGIFAITRHGVVPRDSARDDDLLHGNNPRFLAGGYVVYLAGDNGALMALPFDGARRVVRGPPAPVLQGVRKEMPAGAGQYAVSEADGGTLLYAAGADAAVSRFIWTNGDGRIDTLPFPSARYGSFELSPDGGRIVTRVETPADRAEIWILDLRTGTHIVLDTPGIASFLPAWWPDGKRIVYGSGNFFWRRAAEDPMLLLSENGRRDTLFASARVAVPSPDTKRLLIGANPREPGLWLHSGSHWEHAVRLSPGFRSFASFSPDGRWVAFMDNEPSPEVYVADTKHPERRYKISEGGGTKPRWPARGHSIVYRNGSSLWGVDVALGDTPMFSAPRELVRGVFADVPGWSHDVSSDGRRYLLLLGSTEEATKRLTVAKGLYSELRRSAPQRH